MNLEIAEEVEIGAGEGEGWQEHIIQAARMKVPLGMNREDISPVDSVLNRHPELQDAMQDLLKGPLAGNTMNTYESAIKKFREFMEINKYSMTAITEETLVHYVAHMHKNKVSHGTLCQTKPAIKLLLQMQTGDAEVFTQRVSRMLDAAIRKAAGEKEVVKKAAQVDFQVLIDMMEKFVNPFSNNIFEADIFKLRTVVRVVTEYYTFCRGADYRELKAKHVEESGPDLMVTFPKAKNDQLHQGKCTLLKANDGPVCPVRAMKLMFKRFEYKFGKEGGDESYLHCRIRRSGGRRVADGKFQASMSLAREELQAIMAAIGRDGSTVTDKSFKMLGVTRTLEGGAKVEDVSLHGGWATLTMPLTYKHNSHEFKKFTAGQIPTE